MKNYKLMESKLAGALIRKARLAKGLTSQELGRRTGRTKASISKFENGKQKIHLELIGSVAKALGVEPCELLPFNPKER